ncbi:MAG: glycerol kinase GlpK [Pseudomonadota bacterium]|nr:glycerol kinase GlpK [Pseudomonadota bacterium]
MTKVYLAIDQGTTSSRAILFDQNGNSLFTAQKEFRQIFPHPGWVEHDPEEIWQSVLDVCHQVVAQADKDGLKIAGIGITNQRETVVAWDRNSGEPLANAIVWQDRRTADICAGLTAQGAAAEIEQCTGLVVDPYFSASKIAWILDNVDGARQRAESGELVFGTVETFLVWRLTEGRTHISDATNAARTSLLNISSGDWDEGMCAVFNVPMQMLPDVVDCAGDLGRVTHLFGRELPILSAVGDQQSAAVGQACLTPGAIKSTYGTGCFVILNTGDKIVRSSNRLLSTVAWQLDGQRIYALEGSIFIAGAVIQWLRDGLHLLSSASDSEQMAAGLTGNDGLYMVPAFTGLGAPWWNAEARGAIYGLTRDTGPAQLARAALESVAYQTADLFDAMALDGVQPVRLRVDGGMAANDWLMQFLSDVLDMPVDRPRILETTALGAAMFAGLADGAHASLDDVAASWQQDRQFTPAMADDKRRLIKAGWSEAIMKTRLRFD